MLRLIKNDDNYIPPRPMPRHQGTRESDSVAMLGLVLLGMVIVVVVVLAVLVGKHWH